MPTEDTKPTNSTPSASFRYFSAMAPAATRPENKGMISRMTFDDKVKKRTDCFSRAASATTAARFQAIFEKVGPIRMGGARKEIRLGVVMRSLILVLYSQADRCSQSYAKFCSRLYANGIGFITLRFMKI